MWGRYALVMASALTASGCRADVEGWWSGHVGVVPMTLSLEQKGSSISGEACSDLWCTDIDDGILDEESLVLRYGCRDCPIEATRLDLVLYDSFLEGEAQLLNCTLAEGEPGTCRPAARFNRCQGPCVRGHASTAGGGGQGGEASLGGGGGGAP